jgi:hypothetical protein
MPFQEKIPEWNAEGVEPPASKKAAGWQAGEKPPADYWNWQMHRTYRALRELQEKALHKDDVTASDIPTANGSDIQSEIENLKSSVSDGKAQIAAAITDKGVPTSPTDSFATMAANIEAIPVGPDTSDATATAADILAGKVAYGAGDQRLVGTMPNRGAVNITPGPSPQSIPAGYHNGSGQVAAVVFDPSKVLEGTTIAGTAGTMPNRTGHVTGQSISRSGTTLRIRPQPGYYPGDAANSVQINEPNLLPENIRQGKSIFGVSGSLVPGASIKNVQRGQTAMTSTTRTVTISPVDVNKSFVKLSINSSAGNQSSHVLGKLIDATTLQLEVYSQYQYTTVYWEVVEFETIKSLQKGETIVSGQISVSVTISSVDTTKAFVIFSDLDDLPSHRSNYAYLYSNTTLVVGTPSGGGTVRFYWYVIEF